MPMPKASVDEDHTPVFGQDDIKTSRQAPVIGVVAKPLSEQKAPDKQFCLGIASFD